MMKIRRKSISLLIFMIFIRVLSADTLDFDAFNGTGQFINAKGGTITSTNDLPYDDVIGTLYVSGDFGEDNYSDSVQTDAIFSALDFNGVVISVSPVYNAEIGTDSSTDEYYFILIRNKFDEGIIENDELGKILEAGYFDDNNLLKDEFYNDIKNFNSSEELNSAVDETFGVNFYPLITKQTLEIITDANTSAMDFVSSIDKYSVIGVKKVVADYNFNRVKVDGEDNFDGYRTKSIVISVGTEQKISSYLKRGSMFTFIDSTTDMDNLKGERDDFFYQGRLYTVYDVDSVIFSSMLSVGGSDTDIYRYKSSTLGDFMNISNLTNFYLGLNNSVYKKYQLGKLYITPKAELNLIGLNQRGINEDGDYGLEINEINTLSVKPGIGFDIERNFRITDKTKLNIGADIMNYIEVAAPYEELEVKLKTVSPEKGTIEKYDSNPYYVDFSLRQGLKSLNGLSFSLAESCILFEDQKRFKFELKLELIYRF